MHQRERVNYRAGQLAALFFAAALAGCGNQAGGEDAAQSDTAGGSEAPDVPLVDCEDNSQCVGGEVCRGRLCREACGIDDACTGPLPVCDEGLGICVACTDDQDCGADEACLDNTCEFFCTNNQACERGHHCDHESGGCIENECEEDADCSGGFHCRLFACLPIDDIVCESNSRHCDDNTMVGCSGDGTHEVRLDCAERVCIGAEAGVRCAERVCQPNRAGCLDDLTAFSCDATGTTITAIPCRNDRYCEEGHCRDPLCEANTVSCQGNTLVACDERGTSLVTTACGEQAHCNGSDFGCTCVAGACEERLCRPSSARCVGDSRQPCADDGLSYLDVRTCEDDHVCVAGACMPNLCEGGHSVCVGDVLVECRENGSSRDETDCASSGQICGGLAGSATCRVRACQPDHSTCSDSGTTVVECDTRGASTHETECDSGQYCSDGACVPDVCPPGEGVRCVEGDLRRCNDLGSGYELVETCDRETQRCEDAECVVRVTGDEICVGGADEDGDFLIDCSDSDCSEDSACAATSAEDCSNSIDDDDDGLADCSDPDCASACGGEQDQICIMLCLMDPSGSGICNCTGGGLGGETDCTDGVDNDGNGATDCDDPTCIIDPSCL